MITKAHASLSMVIISRCALLVTLASSNHLGVALELYVCGSKQEVDHEEAVDLFIHSFIHFIHSFHSFISYIHVSLGNGEGTIQIEHTLV